MTTILATDREGHEHAIKAELGLSLMLNLKVVGDLDVAAICGGMCSCGTCHVLLDPEWFARLPPAAPDEIELIEDNPSFAPGASRLSCQITVDETMDGIRVVLAPED
jgi:2Fe-2S ferredoxin